MHKEGKSRDLRIEDTNDLRSFMSDLKLWAEANNEIEIKIIVENAERRAFTASEMLIAYSEGLNAIRAKFMNHLPDNYKLQIERGIRVADDAVNLGSYTYKAS